MTTVHNHDVTFLEAPLKGLLSKDFTAMTDAEQRTWVAIRRAAREQRQHFKTPKIKTEQTTNTNETP